jgi:histidinol-phosphate aminotransferase
VKKLIRRHLSGIEPYKPIVPVEVLAQRLGIPAERLIKLDGNENLYGCSPQVQRALADYHLYYIYPDPLHFELREMLEGYTGLGREYIVVGSGSDELIDLILRLSLEPGDKVINCPPTFGMYPFSTEICGGKVVDAPRDSNFEVDVAAVNKAIDERTKVIFLNSPNNPTGNITPEKEVLELLDTGLLVVVDEAYYEFSGVSVAPLVPHYPNLVVLRSFSKWAGLAGLRVGYGIFPEGIAELMYKIKPPYNVNIAAQIAVKESLADINYLRDRIKDIISERERLFLRLGKLRFLKPYPSQANFILCSVLNGDAQGIKQVLEKRGIFIRYFDTPLLKNMLRISVGKPEHSDVLIQALSEIFGPEEVE